MLELQLLLPGPELFVHCLRDIHCVCLQVAEGGNT